MIIIRIFSSFSSEKKKRNRISVEDHIDEAERRHFLDVHWLNSVDKEKIFVFEFDD